MLPARFQILKRTGAFALLFVAAPGWLHSGGAEEGATGTAERVGPAGQNRFYTPANQLLTPAGIQVELPGSRPLAIALSPDGRLLVTSGKTNSISVLEPAGGKLLQKVPFPGRPGDANNQGLSAAEAEEKGPPPLGTQVKPDGGAQLSFTGLIFSRDGTRIYVSNVNGDIKVFSVVDGIVAPLTSIPLSNAMPAKRTQEIPAGLAITEDGKRLYVCGNLSNSVYELNAADGTIRRVWEVGVAPYDVALHAGKLYVSNWGGPRPDSTDLTGPAGRGMTVRVDPIRHIANSGSVSVIDLKASRVTAEIPVELHASALAVSPGGRHVVCANAGSDSLSVIDTRKDEVVERISVRDTPGDLFSAMPDAICFDRTGETIYVCNATLNAIAVVQFSPEEKKSKLQGMMPVAWFPGAIALDSGHHQLAVANIKGIGSRKYFKPDEALKYNSHDYFGTLSLVPLPSAAQLPAETRKVRLNARWPALEAASLPPRPEQPARAVPERAGEPSLIEHVIYIIKENRTYDQILGDVAAGEGNAFLCTFGEKYTPNQHQLVHDFVLLDNTYCSGIQSGDGHQWADSAITTEYVEREHAGWPRSYPSMKTADGFDALAYSPAGFLWDNALRHKVTVRIFGEGCTSDCLWADKTKKGRPSWRDFYLDVVAGGHQTLLHSKPGLASLIPIADPETVGWDLNVPDVSRAAHFIQQLRYWEERGEMPRLLVMALPNDHTGGNSPGKPTPAAQIADNDLALGRIVEALSQSKFWASSAVFAIEDDPQNGWDHISGYRTTCYVAGGRVRRGAVVHTQYNQTSLIRTMELMLGLPPMNIMDASATPMSDCFREDADLTAWHAVPAIQQLDELTPEPRRISNRQLRRDAITSSKLALAAPDKCPENLLNRILWRSMKGPNVPYPLWAITGATEDDDD